MVGRYGSFREMGFSCDANGRMVKATKDQMPEALSVYDASGMRVARSTPPYKLDTHVAMICPRFP
jgi:hypothetical protein